MESDRKKQSQEHGRTSTADVLGGRPNGHRVSRKWAEHHKRLTELRKRFIGEKHAGSESGKVQISTFSEHMADAATDSYDRDWALAMLTSAQNILYEIDEALNRISNGTYGTCELNGTRIEAARLKAIPWTRFSAAAQAELEARGISSRTQLGERGSYFSAEGATTETREEGQETAGEREKERETSER